MQIGRTRLRSAAMRAMTLACVATVLAAPTGNDHASPLLAEAMLPQAHRPKATVVFRSSDCGFAMSAFDELERLALDGRLDLRGYIVGNIADGDVSAFKRAYRIRFALNSLSEREAKRWMSDHVIKGTPALLVTDAGGRRLLSTKLNGGVAGVRALRDQISRVLPVPVKPGSTGATTSAVLRTE